MRAFALLLVIAGVIAISGIVSAQVTVGNCADGTQYGKCSAKYPGQYCTGSISDPTLGTLISTCPCTNFPGYIQQGEGDSAECIAAKCTDGTTSGACGTTKPKQCVNGALVDNATACGCPAGKRVAADGVFCEFIPCNDSGVNVPEGTCSPKKGKMCTNGQLVDKASQCGCAPGLTMQGDTCGIVCSDGTKDGDCSATKPKICTNGYLLDDAVSCGCPSGQNPVGKQCAASVLGGLGGVDTLGGAPAGNQSGSGGASSPLSCCCLPTALVGIVGGFVVFRKRK